MDEERQQHPSQYTSMINEAACNQPRRTTTRTKELLLLAENLSVQVAAQTSREERCLLRRMVEMFLGQE